MLKCLSKERGLRPTMEELLNQPLFENNEDPEPEIVEKDEKGCQAEEL